METFQELYLKFLIDMLIYKIYRKHIVQQNTVYYTVHKLCRYRKNVTIKFSIKTLYEHGNFFEFN